MECVQSKADRSMKLLESLSSERSRWDSGGRTERDRRRCVAVCRIFDHPQSHVTRVVEP
jgi:hypothetical protein